MADASDEDDDGADEFVSENKADPEAMNKRKDRAEHLRKMMDDDGQLPPLHNSP